MKLCEVLEPSKILGTSSPENWENFIHKGEVDGKQEGFGGSVGIYTATNTKTKKDSWFIKHPRLGHFRMVSSDHTLIRKFKQTL